MDVYKLKTGLSTVKKIDKDTFEQDTLKKSPYYSEDSTSKESPFAVCPACDNPIQLIGLYSQTKHIIKPYGRHIPKSIPDLAEYNQEAYNFCPYANPKQKLTKEDRKKSTSSLASEILLLLRKQLDRIVYILSKETGIIFTENLVKSMLNEYLGMKGFLYTGATLINVPWIFAYMSNSQTLYGRKIKQDSELAFAIVKNIPGLNFNEKGQIVNTTNSFLELDFCFIQHEVMLVESSLKETMNFVVSQSISGENKIIYEKVVTFDHLYFQNLINPARDNLNRNASLLSLAEKHFTI